jgi:pimeloyl-ACP methyl ester carboxylesterase
MRRLNDFNLHLDWADVARAVAVPALVLRRDDELTTRAASREVVEALPDARWANLPGDSHLVYLGDHRPLVAAIDAFVAECLARRRVA